MGFRPSGNKSSGKAARIPWSAATTAAAGEVMERSIREDIVSRNLMFPAKSRHEEITSGSVCIRDSSFFAWSYYYLMFSVCGQGGESVDGRLDIFAARLDKPWMVENTSSKICSGWYAWPFSPGSFEMYFHVQISLCKNEKLVVFFWLKQGQKGTGRAEIYIF